MAESSLPEYDTLIKCTTDLVLALRANPMVIADKLLSCQLISADIYGRLQVPAQDGDTKARLLVTCVLDQVKLNQQNYVKFLNILSGEMWLETVTKKLLTTYDSLHILQPHHSLQSPPQDKSHTTPEVTVSQQPVVNDVRTNSSHSDIQHRSKRSIQEEIDKLQQKFHDLTMNTCVHLSSKEEEVPNFVTEFRMYIAVLPGHIRKQYQASLFSKSKQAELKQLKSIEEIFCALGEFWNYLNPLLLGVVVKKFGTPLLHEQFQQYEQDLHQFCTRTKVVEHPAWVHYPPHDFSEVVLKLNVDENECTIAQLFEFRSNIAQHSSIEPYSIGVKNGTPGSLYVNLSLPRALTPLFVETLDADILKKQEIISIEVDGVNILKYKSFSQDQYPLVEAALRGYIEIAATLIENGSDVNQQNLDGKTALICASSNGHHDVVISLLAAPGININLQDEGGKTALNWASFYGHHDVVISLLAAPGINVNLQDEDGRTALIWASVKGHCDVVISLLAVPGINVNLPDEYGWTALTSAIIGNHADVVLSLLTAPDINVNIQDKDGNTALHHMACSSGHNDVVQALVAFPGIEVNIQNQDRDTALHDACYLGHKDVVQALLPSPGIEVNTQNEDGDTALHKACISGCNDVVQTLIVYPAIEVNILNKVGLTPLIETIVGYEIQSLAVTDTPGFEEDKDGLTAHMMATRQNYIQVVQILIRVEDVGTDIQEESAGWSALFFAAEKGYLEIVQLLLDAGADTTLRDKEGVTALDVATVHEQQDVIAELEKHVSGSQGVNTCERVTGIDQTLRDRVLRSGRRAARAFNKLLEETFLRAFIETDYLAA